jgi:L-asparaginase
VAEALGPVPAKTVVLVGSLTPAQFKATDAVFNVGFAAAAVQALPPGVYVTMNGCVFRPEAVRKNRARNRFEPVGPGPS